MKIQCRYLWCASYLLALACVAANAGNVKADVVANPDANTLWREDGNSAPVGEASSASHWSGNLDIRAGGGKLVFSSSDDTKVSAGRYVATDSTYPYLSWRINDFEPLGGYRALSIFFSNKSPALNLVSQISPGAYVLDMTPFIKAEPEPSFLSIYLYGSRISVSGLAMSRAPENRIEIEAPEQARKAGFAVGDEMKFTVCLAEDTEDVTLSFFDSYTMPQLKINGQQTLQLKPEGENYKRWSGAIRLQTVENLAGDLAGQPEGTIPALRLVAKATILGGAFKEPLWTAVPYPIHLAAPKAALHQTERVQPQGVG